MKTKHDYGLTGRIILTWALLLLVYLIFMGILTLLGLPLIFILLIIGGLALVQYFFSDRLVLMSTGSRIIEYDEAPDLHRLIEKICLKASVPKPRVAIMHSSMPNAFATGRSPNHAVIAVTDSIMMALRREELEAVLAHEISHIKNRDILTMTVASFIAMIASLIMNNFLFASFINRGQGGAWMIAGIVAAVVWFVSTILMMALSRYREYAADRGAAYITQDPDALISALKKISGKMDRLPPKTRQEAQGANAFYIIPAVSKKTMAALFATHPALEKRIENLEQIRAEIRGY